MDLLASDWLLHNWKQKLVALLMATLIWLFVNHSITSTKTVTGIIVRVVNLSSEKAIEGLLPNGVLNKRMTLTLTGTKEVIENIEPGDLEVVLDASNAPEEWIVQISKQDLRSLNPDIDISRDISQISHPEFVIDLDKMMTAKIPVTILQPTGKAPAGYEFLGIWPNQLMQTVTGPKTAVQQLHTKGLELTFDLSEISKEELDAILSTKAEHYSDEVSYKVPDIWKKIPIPLLNQPAQTLNDPNGDNLHIDFLRKDYIPIKGKIPIRIFYPLDHITTVNPLNHPLKITPIVEKYYEIPVLNLPLLAYNTSRLFVDVVRDHIEIVITAEGENQNVTLPWNVEFLGPELLEEKFVHFLSESHNHMSEIQNEAVTEQRKAQWRERFRKYMKNMILYLEPDIPLILESKMESNGILVEQK